MYAAHACRKPARPAHLVAVIIFHLVDALVRSLVLAARHRADDGACKAVLRAAGVGDLVGKHDGARAHAEQAIGQQHGAVVAKVPVLGDVFCGHDERILVTVQLQHTRGEVNCNETRGASHAGQVVVGHVVAHVELVYDHPARTAAVTPRECMQGMHTLVARPSHTHRHTGGMMLHVRWCVALTMQRGLWSASGDVSAIRSLVARGGGLRGKGRGGVEEGAIDDKDADVRGFEAGLCEDIRDGAEHHHLRLAARVVHADHRRCHPQRCMHSQRQLGCSGTAARGQATHAEARRMSSVSRAGGAAA